MWKALLLGSALLGACAGAARAQGQPPDPAPASGPLPAPGVMARDPFSGAVSTSSATGANNGNNTSAAALSGAGGALHPGEARLRFGGRVNVTGGAGWSSQDSVPGRSAH